MEQIYPTGPAAVPEQLARPAPSYRRKAWLAVAGLVSFVALYFALAGWFVAIAWRLLGSAAAGGGGIVLGIAGLGAAFLAVFMLKALFFMERGRSVDGTEITRAAQPRLFAFLDRLADEAKAPRPHRVFVSGRVNAAVFYDLSLYNLLFPSKKNLEIGLGLVNMLDLGEFKAVCAHEFGHFTQRSMAVGRWVYTTQQIASHIVARRDALDRMLGMLSRSDFRIAWVGWTMGVIVWSIRSLVDSVFRLVVLAQRSLSREMEMQADLVAVSLTGSDALIHALHRLNVADDAWDRALGFARTEAAGKRAPIDVFALQPRVAEHMSAILNDPDYGRPPLSADGDGSRHRVFRAELAQPPRMWSTHPQNHEREENAKRTYVSAPVDQRSAWVLFDDAQGLRERMTAELLGQAEGAPVSTPSALKALDEHFGSEHLKRAYRGIYLGRSVVRHVGRPDELYGSERDISVAALDTLYPEALNDEIERRDSLQKEKALLEALRDGRFTASGGVIRHRERTLARHELPRAIAGVEAELAAVDTSIQGHDRRCRTLHLAVALHYGRGWNTYLQGLGEVLHYADHAEADLRDLQRQLNNVYSIATATRKVNARGIARILEAGGKVHQALAEVFNHSVRVSLDPVLVASLGTSDWSTFLGEYGLQAPTRANISSWLGLIDGWINRAAGALGALRRTTLDLLLVTESRMAQALRNGSELEDAPAPSRVATNYPTLLPGQQRKLQSRLGWWARFQTASGIVPGFARFAVSFVVVGAVIGAGWVVGSVDVMVYNGLGRTVNVAIGKHSVVLPPYASRVVELAHDESFTVKTTDGAGHLIETFDVSTGGGIDHQVYNVASASPLVEWTAVYGNASQRPPRMLGTPRWLHATADVVFADPPHSVKTKGGGATRTVLNGAGQAMPDQMLGMLDKPADRQALIATHIRWDDGQSPWIQYWFAAAQSSDDLRQLIAERLAAYPADMMARRFEQDTVTGADREQVCARDRQAAAVAKDDADLQYLAARCVTDKSAQNQAFLDGHKTWPGNAWFAYAAGYTFAGRGDWADAMESLKTAGRNSPAVRPSTTLDLARLTRLQSRSMNPGLDEMAKTSPQLQIELALESGQGIDDGAAKSYALLARGHLDDALQAAAGTPAEARILRLVAASDNAPAAAIQRAMALPMDQGLDETTVWPTLALVARNKGDFAPYGEILKKVGVDHGDETVSATMLAFVRLVQSGDTAGAERQLNALPLDLRAQAYAIGTIVLGHRAPANWRDGAQYLLFVTERPYFG